MLCDYKELYSDFTFKYYFQLLFINEKVVKVKVG